MSIAATNLNGSSSSDKPKSGKSSPDEASPELARVLPFATVGSGPQPSQKRLERAAQIVQDAVSGGDTTPDE